KMDKKCIKKLKDLIQNVVLPDVEDYIDDIFEEITDNKNASDDNSKELEDMQEMRKEFQAILKDIENDDLDQDECAELFDEISLMIKEEESK
ncbi:MAG: hypothetical protein U9R16_08300, partial [Campylobacterota bacterium]|nr:hypothetical protein [Campylobacterota bacterium]